MGDGVFGLFDGFEGYRTATEADYDRLLGEGDSLVVLDTNVLLDLYRMNHRLRADMLAVLEALRHCLWMPHQVLGEFWRNQQSEDVFGRHQLKAAAVKEVVQEARASVRQAVERWSSEVHPDERRRLDASLTGLEEQLRAVERVIDEQVGRDAVPGAPDTTADPVVRALEGLFAGRVGARPTAERHAYLVNEAKDRALHQIPPGFKDFDAGKADVYAAGDYLLWVEVMSEARARQQDVVFVTRDLKEDWWRPTRPGQARQPRVELVDELRRETSRRLFMLEPSELMRHACRIFDLGGHLDAQSVGALKQLETTIPLRRVEENGGTPDTAALADEFRTPTYSVPFLRGLIEELYRDGDR